MVPSTLRKAFFNVLSNAEKNIEEFVHNPGKDMTRHRRCTFTDTVLAILNFSMERTSTELFNFFKVKKRHDIPTKSAFTQQRKKLKGGLFLHMMNELNATIPFKKTFRGFYLVAVDGSDVNLPTDKNDQVYRVKQARSDNYYYQLHLSCLYNILDNRYVDAVTQPRSKMNENDAFCTMLDRSVLPDNTIFIADRGYTSLNTLAHLINSGKFFLIRCKSPASNSYLKGLIAADYETDTAITLGITRSRAKHTCDADAVKYIRNDRKFDFIAPDDHKTVFTMELRCTCIRIGEDSYEYLISNLPMETFTSNDLKDLYWKRWSVETSFRSLKYALSVVYLHSVNRDLIIQEIFAKMLLYNVTAVLHAFAEQSNAFRQRCNNRQHRCRVSFENAVSIAKMLLTKPIKNSTIKALLLMHITEEKEIAAPTRRLRSQTVRPLSNRA